MYSQPLKKTMRNFIIVLLIAMLVLPFGVPSAQAKEIASAKVVKIAEGHMGLPSALDDQGNLWATSVSSRAYRKNFFQYRANFVKMESMGKVLDISSRFVLKEDGTVWAIEYEESKEQDKDKWGLYTPSYITQVQGLEHIVKIDAVGGSNVLALDRDGRLWLADSYLRWVRSAVSPVDPPFSEETTLIQGIDHIKDISGALLLKEDGTVWTSACQQQACDVIKSMRAGSPKKIEGLEDIVKLSGYGLALKKDGTVWSWGLNSLAVEKTGDSFASAAPFQIEGLSGIVDIAFNGGRLLAAKNDGTVWGKGRFSTRFWGKDTYFPLHQIEGLTDISAVLVNDEMIGAIKKDGSLWMWGDDYYGLIGDHLNLQPKPTRVELRPDKE